jgi:quercetin dioxygenase-like cupin family protein
MYSPCSFGFLEPCLQRFDVDDEVHVNDDVGMPNFIVASASDTPAHPVGPGVSVRRLYRSDPSASARRAVVLEFEPGSRLPYVDVHAPGPEEVYVLSGTFHGLTGEGSEHQAGDFIHCDAGTEHQPFTPTGGALFIYLPEG